MPTPKPIPYNEFRTGLTYVEVYYMVFSRKWKRRNGVLGAWREIKQRMYREYLDTFDYTATIEEVPF